MESGVDMDIFLQKKLGAGFFGGEGFIMQRFSGQGLAFLEIGGSLVEYDLGPGQVIMVDTGYLAAMDTDLLIDIQMVKGVKNVLFGGEGLFNTRITGRATSGCRPCRPRPWPAPSSPSCPSTAADGAQKTRSDPCAAAVSPGRRRAFPRQMLIIRRRAMIFANESRKNAAPPVALFVQAV